MTKREFHSSAHFILAILIAFTLPFAKLTAGFIALMLLNWLLEMDFRNKFKAIGSNKLTMCFIAFFIMHLLGLIYTENINSGLFDIQVKLSLLFFPIILTSRPFDNKKVNYIFLALLIGSIISSLLLFIIATYAYLTLSLNHFFYQEFSILIHPSYLSMYINLCIAWLLLKLLNIDTKSFSIKNKISLVIIAFLSFTNILLSSKMGLVSMLLIYIFYLWYYIILKRKYFLSFLAFLILLGIIFSAIKLFPEMARRLSRSVEAFSHPTLNQSENESTAVRFLIWSAANKVISENVLFGAGTGDAKDALIKEYEKRGMKGALEHKLNAHNEFYQVFISIGIIGFIIFVITLLAPLSLAFKINNFIYIIFLFIIVFNFLPESMLETQAGVMFYSFFNSLLCFSCYNPKLSFQNQKPL